MHAYSTEDSGSYIAGQLHPFCILVKGLGTKLTQPGIVPASVIVCQSMVGHGAYLVIDTQTKPTSGGMYMYIYTMAA